MYVTSQLYIEEPLYMRHSREGSQSSRMTALSCSPTCNVLIPSNLNGSCTMGNREVNNEGLHNSAIDVYIRRVDIRLLVQAQKSICSRVQIKPKNQKETKRLKVYSKRSEKEKEQLPKNQPQDFESFEITVKFPK